MGPEPSPLASAVRRPDTNRNHHEENSMSIATDTRRVQNQAMEVRVVKPLQFVDRTPQTTGMRRLAAISHLLAGSESLWAGVMLAEPNTTSSVHHHGPLETVVYVLSGTSKVRWGSRLEHDVDLEAGDF